MTTKKELKAMGEEAARLYLLRCLWGACRQNLAYDALLIARETFKDEGEKEYAQVIKDIEKARGAVIDFEYDLIVAKDKRESKQKKRQEARDEKTQEKG